jgi:hypothetical protein
MAQSERKTVTSKSHREAPSSHPGNKGTTVTKPPGHGNAEELVVLHEQKKDVGGVERKIHVSRATDLTVDWPCTMRGVQLPNVANLID